MEPATIVSTVAAVDRRAELKNLVAGIKRDLARGEVAFLKAGRALNEIRDRRLYRVTHRSLKHFIMDTFEGSRPRVYQLIAAATTWARLEAELSTTVDMMPTSERQVRPLTALPPDQQPAAWQEAVATAPGGKPTAAHVRSVVSRIKPVAGVAAPAVRVAARRAGAPDASRVTKGQRELAIRHRQGLEGILSTLRSYCKTTLPSLNLDKVRLVCDEEEIAGYAEKLKGYIEVLDKFHARLTRWRTE